MITLFFIFLASFLSAVIERHANDYFYRSVFKHLNPCFWNRKQSPFCVDYIFSFPLDAGFFLRLLRVIFICFSIVCYYPVTVPPVDFFLFFGVWVFNFNFFNTLMLKQGRK